MALFFPDDASYDESVRMTGFYRYRQLLSMYAFGWLRTNLMTVLGAIPLALGIGLAISTSSLLLLLPLSIVGGMIFGPFFAAMVDNVMRGLRDAPGRWWESYRKGFRQNIPDSLLPGALTGLIAGAYSFMIYMFSSAEALPGATTYILMLFSALLVIILEMLYWPQLVLFQQPIRTRLVNTILFTSKYLWRVLIAAVLVLLWILILFLFAPWTLILIPFLGFWWPVFLSQFLIYKYLDEELQIEKRIDEAKESEKGMDMEESSEG